MDEQVVAADLNNGIVDSSIDESYQAVKSIVLSVIINYVREERDDIKSLLASHIESLGVSDIETKLVTIRTALETYYNDDSKSIALRGNAYIIREHL